MSNLKQLAVAAFAALVLAGSCSDNPALRNRYAAEKMLHDAEKAFQQVQSSGEFSKAKLRELAPQFRQIVDYCYAALDSTDSTAYPMEHNELKYLTYESSTRLSQIAYALEDYGQSIQIFNTMLEHLQPSGQQLVQIYVNLGQTLQISRQWDSALTVYTTAIEKFYPPLNNSGEVIYPILNLPLHLFRIESMLGNQSAAGFQMSQADAYYKGLARDYGDTKLKVAAYENLAYLYDGAGRWRDEIAALELIMDPTQESYRNIVVEIGDIYGTHLRRFDTALSLYATALDRTDRKDSLFYDGIRFKMALIRMEQGRYATAREMIQQIKDENPRFYDTTPLMQYSYGRSYELEDKWQRAEAEYSLLIEKYRGSQEAMMTLLYLIDYYKERGAEVQAQRWQNEAEKYFDDVAQSGAGTVAELTAKIYKAEMFTRIGKNGRAAEEYRGVFDKYPISDQGQFALRKAIDLYRNKLGQPAVADSLETVLKSAMINIERAGSSEDLLVD